MSPLLCLAHAASVTTRIRLATGLLILPYYHPVTLAREIQTLWHLSGGRFVLGVGPGWDQHEFETLGMKLAERGRRTDEMIAALRRLLTERDVSFAGRHYRFDHVTIEPLLPRVPELWVGGGSKIQTSLSPDKPYVAPAVLARIAGADGWLARAAGNQQMVKDDVQAIRDHLVKNGRDPDTLRYGHLNFAHLVDTTDREQALRLQRPVFERVMGTHRTFENLQQSYFLGTTREIVERIRDLEAGGIQDMVLATCDYDLEQLERFASEIVPRFKR
jgi:alkanesulfonate monooxygenase SsuD/methylene tetrahydromethanopterin reductase-like flavin-dependent oxidoreductase (luciferase family)